MKDVKAEEQRRYWQQRIEAAQHAAMARDETTEQVLASLYRANYAAIKKEIEAFYQRYAVKNKISVAEAKKRADRFDVQAYADKAKQYVKEKNFSDKANRELALYNLKMKISRLELLLKNIDLEVIALANEQEKIIRDKKEQAYIRELKDQAGILGQGSLSNDEVKRLAKIAADKPFNGAKFSTRIWRNQKDLQRYLNKAVQRTVLTGKNPRVLAKKLRERYDVKKYEAYRLAVTETAYVQSQAQKESMLTNDYELYDIVIEPTACRICRAAADNNPYKVSEMVPGINAEPFHPHCYCTTVPHAEREALDELLDNLDFNNDD